MNFELPPVGQPNPTSAPSRTPRVAAAAPGELGAAVEVNLSIPSSPPPELRAEMAAASRRVDELAAQDRELHFELDDNGRIVIEVRDLDGNVIRSIPPSRMLDVAAGAPLEV
jgi:flagellar protein FlaG